MLKPDKVRKIEKWYPFAALSDPIAGQYHLDRINNLKTQPELSEEQIEEINQVMLAIRPKETKIALKYFKDGQIIAITGRVDKVNLIDRFIIIQETKYEFTAFISIEITGENSE
ncbi:YolD-like family protein [Culicoidibacter larvae]|uniref:YolD-like family protein n=1 Tax=Culicoidibacter larvae TaxID=2579976 RepID=A0A5R8Q713_9FIRM|nr:YolD-like family protein [Culicoidibacter larvae]TLG71186.1 YolD-like family protein [Culicoidibacter larvae]